MAEATLPTTESRDPLDSQLTPGSLPGGDQLPRTGLPPSPRLPRLAQTALWAVAPGALSRYCRRRFGETFTLRPLGIGDVVVLTQPETIREVFTGDREVFRAGEANAVLGPMVGEHSLLLLDGERHLRHRRLLSAPFHGDAVRAYGERIAEIAAAEVDRWPVGVEFPIRPRMQAITLEVILRTVVGVRDERRLERLRVLLRKLTQVGIVEMWAVWAYPGLMSRPLPRRLSTLRLLPAVDRLLYEEIAAHRADPEGREDVLALLLAARDEQGEGLSDRELRDHLITLLVAGHETTTTALAWCFERLLRHPAALARLEGELAEGEQETYLEAVLNETLRVRPVIDAVWRKLSAPAEVAGYALPAGATVMPSIVMVQGSEAFADAESFRPERFLEGSPPQYTFIPFGGGPRRCIGASFAMMEMRAIVRTVLERVELRAPSAKDERVKAHHITFVPARGGRVIVTGRRPTRSDRKGSSRWTLRASATRSLTTS
ncbi:MAG TPA: cytochrome P450 [Solirubrobacteraceae bacterium]|nr:cytochrome P450 [Solirubrobacteraceae bacterium]